jgi:alkylation response protein AidB-like acyl-CoA dehydrogenase
MPPEALRPKLAKAIIEENAIIGLAVAEAGRKVDDPLKTTATPEPDGGFVIDGRKIYTTGAAEADLIAVWAFNPEAPGIAENPLNGATLNLVPKGAAGVTIHRDWDALGQRGTDSGTVTFDKVKTDPLWRGNIPGSFAAARFAPLSGGVRGCAGWRRRGGAARGLRIRRQAEPALALRRGRQCGQRPLRPPPRAVVRATSEIYALMGTRSASRANGFDRFWRNARTLSLHDPVDWKNAELGRHVLTGWDPPPGLYQ